MLVALRCFRGVSNGVLESLFQTSARVFRRYFGIYLLRGDLDPGRDIEGPNLGNAEQSLDLRVSAVMNCFWYRNDGIVVLSR